MFSCLQILEAFLWFVLITLLNVTLIILTLSVSRLRSEERFSRNAETDLVCRLLLEKKKNSDVLDHAAQLPSRRVLHLSALSACTHLPRSRRTVADVQT